MAWHRKYMRVHTKSVGVNICQNLEIRLWPTTNILCSFEYFSNQMGKSIRISWGIVQSSFFLITFYLFVFREGGRERGSEGEKHQCERGTSIGYLPMHPDGGPNMQPGHESGGESNLRPFSLRCSTNWATPVRASQDFLKESYTLKSLDLCWKYTEWKFKAPVTPNWQL